MASRRLRVLVLCVGCLAVLLGALTPASATPAAKPAVACEPAARNAVWFNYSLGQTFATELDSVSSWQVAVYGLKPFKGTLAGRLMLYPAGNPIGDVGPGIVLAEVLGRADVRTRETRWIEFKPSSAVSLPLTGSAGRYGIEVDFPVDVTRPRRDDWSELAWSACAAPFLGGRAFHIDSAESQQRRFEQDGTMPKLAARLPKGGIVRTSHQFPAFAFRVFGD